MAMVKPHLPNWVRILMSAIVAVAMLIGFAGIPQTVKAYLQDIPWLSENVPWWVFLLFASFLAVVVWKSADTKRSEAPGDTGGSPQFLPNQRTMLKATGGLAVELASLRNGWAAWETGDFLANRISDGDLPNLRRLILLDPASRLIDRLARDDDHKRRIRDSIYQAQKRALGAGIAVRLNDGPLLNSIFHDPEGRSAWVRAQMFIPHQASSEWPSYRVEKASDPDRYKTLFRSYQKLWDESLEISTPVRAEDAIEPPKPVATETVDRFREVYDSCRKATQFAFELLMAEVTTTLTCFPEAQSFRPAEQAVGRLVEHYVLPAYSEAQARCDELVRMKDLDEDELHQAKNALYDCLRTYRDVLYWLNEGGQIIGGEAFFGRPAYADLRRRHAACLAELERVKVRQDLQMRNLVDHHRGLLKNALGPPPQEASPNA